MRMYSQYEGKGAAGTKYTAGKCRRKQKTGPKIENQGLESGRTGGVHGTGYSATEFTSRTGIHIHILKNQGYAQHNQHTSRVAVQTFL